MQMSAFFMEGHTNINSHVEDDRNAYGIILLAIYYPEVAAFLMFALATRLSPNSRVKIHSRRPSQNFVAYNNKGKSLQVGLSYSFRRLHKTFSCACISHPLPAPYAASNLDILVVRLASHLKLGPYSPSNA